MDWRHIKHIPHALVPDYEQLGWKVEVPVRWTNHDFYSVPMRWLCDCPPAEPRPHSSAVSRET